MNEALSDSTPSDSVLSPRALLKREWPYLLVLVLTLFGIAYASFSRTQLTLYWIVLAPLMGVICVATRWPDTRDRDARLRLVWTQALHWAAVLLRCISCSSPTLQECRMRTPVPWPCSQCWRSGRSRPASILGHGGSASSA